jgi:predicted nucleic acid-binding protein
VRLAADASALVAEALRKRGRDFIAHDDLDLIVAAPAWSETLHEVRRRLDQTLQRGHIDAEEHAFILSQILTTLNTSLAVVTEMTYSAYEAEARDRIPRDPRDWPTVALALAIGCGIWTADQDFFGCGVPVWTTQTLLTHVETGRARASQ